VGSWANPGLAVAAVGGGCVVFLVALGMDYNIFLITWAREDARRAGTRNGTPSPGDVRGIR
jgi:uncharacterized membrane protein YdfJ with MMPL/SSD domain